MRMSFVLVLAMMILGCRQRATEESTPDFKVSGGDGTSPEKEVYIIANRDAEVQAAQRAWLSEKYPGLRIQRPGFIIGMGFRNHETIEVITSAGLTNHVHFAFAQKFVH